MMKRGWMLLFILCMVVIFSGIADAKLIKIGTVTINNSEAVPADSRGGGEGGPQAAGGPGMPGGAGGSREYNLIYEDDQGLIWLLSDSSECSRA